MTEAALDKIDVDSSPDAWGSHMPALRAIARYIEIRSVIEFGAGLYSTQLFLSRHFPLLESLISLESNSDWADKARTDDPRHVMMVYSSPGECVEKSIGMKADFVFVDSAGSRFDEVEHGLTIAPVVAIHDCLEVELMGRGYKYVRGFNSKIQTVFVSNTVDLSNLKI